MTPSATASSTPTASATTTPTGQGPQVTFLGVLTRFDGCAFCCEASCVNAPTPIPEYDAEGRRVYYALSGQFVVVVEARPGLSGAAVATSLQAVPPDYRPDIWIESSRDLGNGSAKVCDTGPANSGGGGVPGVDPPNFSLDLPAVTNALVDFGCRFNPGISAASPCTIVDATREPRLLTAATAQFCDFVSSTSTFPSGESVLTVALRDTVGNIGPTAQIVVRVATPTATPTP
ncbi:MAG: hypothetical protein HY270_14770 [Deltaproteobacteria bacterium]|nr:hypothetical protein [Deltaproteobacteria bacterium]